MINIRCTKKLLTKLHITKTEDIPVSTNGLGDWYANYFNVSRKQYIIFTNELTTLSVIIPAKEISTIIKRFLKSLSMLLESIGIDKERIEIELREMVNYNFAQTKNRSLLSNMNDLTEGAKIRLSIEPDDDLLKLNMYLAGYLIGPPPYHKPKDKVCSLFQMKEKISILQMDRI